MHVGSRYHTRGDRMMQITHYGTLLNNVGHDLALRHQSRVKLLFLGIISANGGNEGSRRDIIWSEQGVPRCCAGNTDIAPPDCCCKVGNRGYRDPQVCVKLLRETLRLLCVLVINEKSIEFIDSGDCNRLTPALIASATNRYRA